MKAMELELLTAPSHRSAMQPRATRHWTSMALLTLLSAATAAPGFAQSAVTDPVGVTKQTIVPGLQTVGLTLNNPVVFSGVVLSNTNGSPSNVIFDTTSDIGTLLDSTKSYYLEIVEGSSSALVGDRLDVDVAQTQAANGDTIVLKTAAYNTLAMPLGANVLTDYRGVIKQHLTIGQVFGTKGNTPFTGSVSIGTSDQVIVFNPATGGYTIYYLVRDPTGTIEEWWLAGNAGVNRDNTVIPPGSGLFFRRIGATNVDLVVAGEVRTNPFVLPLAAGYNFVALPFPTDESPASMQMSFANGFAGGVSISLADQILLFNGTGFDIYYLLRSPDGSIEQWTKVGGGATDYTTSELLTFSNSFFLRKLSSDPAYVAPVNFPL